MVKLFYDKKSKGLYLFNIIKNNVTKDLKQGTLCPLLVIIILFYLEYVYLVHR